MTGAPDEKRYSLMELAATLGGVISLGRGDPDFDTPRHVLEEAHLRMASSDASLDPRGQKSLRAAIARRYRETKGIEFDPEREILVTNGAQEGLFLSMLALVNPGERVLVPDPRYGSYDGAIATAGGELIEIPTGESYDFSLDPARVEPLASAAKLLVFVNPSNPTGAMSSPAQVRAIAEIAKRAELAVLSDEVYEELVFGEDAFVSIASLPGMRERTITLSSVSKSYAMTGFRVGYLVGPSSCIEAASRLKAILSGPTPLYSQHAATAALEGPQEDVARFRRTLVERLSVMREVLDEMEIPYGKPGGGLFLWADVSGFGVDAETFCRELLTRARVLVFPGTAFGKKWHRYVRISLLQPEARLREGAARIRRFCETAF